MVYLTLNLHRILLGNQEAQKNYPTQNLRICYKPNHLEWGKKEELEIKNCRESNRVVCHIWQTIQ